MKLMFPISFVEQLNSIACFSSRRGIQSIYITAALESSTLKGEYHCVCIEAASRLECRVESHNVPLAENVITFHVTFWVTSSQ